MTLSKRPNPLQKLVRGVIRDLINQANSQKADKPAKQKAKKLAIAKSQSQPKQKTKKRSRHIPLSIRFAVLQRDSHKCVSCGKSPPEVILEVDHKKPFSKGGGNDMSNLQTLCFECNRGKGASS
ncbi:MAG: HNH endonuclease signature motif containing protein [Nostoc sp.]